MFRLPGLLPAAAVIAGIFAAASTADTGDQYSKLLPYDGMRDSQFGVSTDTNGNVGIIGSPGEYVDGVYSGAAYLFDLATGQELFRLVPSHTTNRQFFGVSVAIYGNVAIVGAQFDEENGINTGAAYLFDVTTGNMLHRLIADDPAENQNFGASVGIFDDVAIVGAPADSENGEGAGAAYLFDVNTGVQTAKLLATDGAVGDGFGSSVALNADTAIVGAKKDDDNGADSGSAYLFSISTGVQTRKLVPGDGAEGDYFGCSVDIDRFNAVVGAEYQEVELTQWGSAYVYDLASGHQQAKLAPDDSEFYRFGSNVAISGSKVLVGSPSNDSSTGAAYVFDTDSGSQLAKLLSDAGNHEDYFGMSVGISGNNIFVGAPGDDEHADHYGAAYVFNPLTYQQTFKLLPIEGNVEDFFGRKVDISNGRAIIASPQNTTAAGRTGAAYIYDVSFPYEPGIMFKLVADDGEDGDLFGSFVKLHQNKAYIGASEDNDQGQDSGSVYVFDVNTGVQLGKLLPDEGTMYDRFGYSGDLYGDKAVFGALAASVNGIQPGAAYIFNISTGEQIARLLASDGAHGDFFGFSTAIYGDTVVVGAPYDDDNGDFSGSVYLYDSDTGHELIKLVPADGTMNGLYGTSLAMKAGILAVGAFGDDDNGEASGSVYVYDITDRLNPVLLYKLVAADGFASAEFGVSLDIEGNTLLVGSFSGGSSGIYSGSVYIYALDTGELIAEIIPDDATFFDHFGAAVALDNEVALIGSPNDDDNGHDSGSVYFYDAHIPVPCVGDLDGDGDTDQSDLGILLSAYEINSHGDLDGDGDTDQSDLGILLADYNCVPLK